MPIRLVLADDHPLILDGLERLFGREPDFLILARCLHGEETLQAVRQHRREAGMREAAANLTQRELEIVHLVARSLRNKEIAEALCISEGTVKIHLHHIYEKLHVNSRLELLRYAQLRALV